MSNSSPSKAMGLLIDTDYCTGCHTCEVACQKEHDLELKQWGIKLTQVGPDEYEPRKWQYEFIPVPTDRCDLCAARVDEGRLPTCVHHCQGLCMYFGEVEELAKKMTTSHMVLFTPCER